MNVLQLAAMAQTLGLNVSLTAIGALLPLLSKRAADIDIADVRAVLSVVGLNGMPDEIAEELVVTVRESNVDTLSDILGQEKYFVPLMTKIQAFMKGKQPSDEEQLIDEIPVKCPACDATSAISRRAFTHLRSDEVVDITCLACERSRPIRVSKILLNGV